MSVASGRLPADGVRAMFDRIAPVYDAMNRTMTAGLDDAQKAGCLLEGLGRDRRDQGAVRAADLPLPAGAVCLSPWPSPPLAAWAPLLPRPPPSFFGPGPGPLGASRLRPLCLLLARRSVRFRLAAPSRSWLAPVAGLSSRAGRPAA